MYNVIMIPGVKAAGLCRGYTTLSKQAYGIFMSVCARCLSLSNTALTRLPNFAKLGGIAK
jgi:uncharacterized membrane protein